MESQWDMLELAVGAELAVALILLLPWSKNILTEVVGVLGLAIKLFVLIVPFSAFKLLELYRNNEFRWMCGVGNCADKSISDAVKHTDLCFSACLLYWGIYRIWKCIEQIERMEAQKIKDE